MKRTFLQAILILALCFAVFTFALSEGSGTSIEAMPMTDIASEDSIGSTPSEDLIEDDDEYVAALDKYWIASDETKFKGYDIRRGCENVGEYENCFLIVSRNGRHLRTIAIREGSKNWLKYGFFDFLNNGRKQLIVHTFSGGAHCCYEYEIFDLGARFRTIYTSSLYDPASQIGNQLVPVDINGDGVFEFYQDVMAFDYFGQFGHASAVFPPAIFSFNKKQSRSEISTKKFPNFVIKEMERKIKGMDKWAKENSVSHDKVQESIVRTKFLYLVYAGKENEAWSYFLENYRSADGDGYQEKFRDKFVKEFKELLRADPTYRSIYSKR